MKIKYKEWIAANVPQNPLGLCHKITEKMQAVFPELERIYGEYLCLVWGPRAHRWMVDPDGEIVDPTVAQFPTPPSVVTYQAEVPGAKRPTGKCPNCGELVYDGGYFCCNTCSEEFVAYLNG